MKYIWVLHN